MSDEGLNTMPQFNLTLNGRTYDLNILVEGLSFAHDYAAAEDIRNASKNMAEPKLSPLTLRIEQGLEMLQEMRVRAADQSSTGEGNPDDPASADA